MIEIVIPPVGESITEVDLMTWLVQEGSTVKVDQSLVECECSKANFDLPAPCAGKIIKILKLSGTVGIGEVVAHLEPSQEAVVLPPAPPPPPTTINAEINKDGRLPPQAWGIALNEAVKARFRATGKHLPVLWYDPITNTIRDD